MTSPHRTPTESLAVGPRLVAAHWDSLWIDGDPTVLEPPLVAIVGTREADRIALDLAHAFASGLARNGRAVLSGGALGIDAAAHTGALEGRGRTAVVLPCGLSHAYPMRHAKLYREIVATGGARVSPFPPETPPAQWTFPRRNELLAALCDVLVVVQAPVGSGSLLTAEAARRLGRRVLVVPAAPDDPRGTGCLKLLRMGAQLCTSLDDILHALEHPDGPLLAPSTAPVRERASRTRSTSASTHARTRAPSANAPPAPAKAPRSDPGVALDPVARQVFDALGTTPLHLDEIAREVHSDAAALRSALVTLVLLGLADEHGGRYRRS